MKKRIVIASIMGLILALAMGVPAMANHTPQDTHHHHIHLPNGNCIDIVSLHTAMERVMERNQSPLDFDHAWQSPCP